MQGGSGPSDSNWIQYHFVRVMPYSSASVGSPAPQHSNEATAVPCRNIELVKKEPLLLRSHVEAL
jgi:hypothetical protein